MTVPMDFKAKVVLSPAPLLVCVYVVDQRVRSDATPAFSTNKGVHCIRMLAIGGQAAVGYKPRLISLSQN